MMNKKAKAILMLTGGVLLAGCVEHSSVSEYYDTRYNSATTGYNRDYNKRRNPQNIPNRGYSSVGNTTPMSPPTRIPSNGYSSNDGNPPPGAPTAPPANGGYGSSSGQSEPPAITTPLPPTGGNDGYSSSGG